MSLRVVPVIDLRSGQAVHARGGRRDLYRPVDGVLGSGDDPFRLALAFRDTLGLPDLYVADLDAIEGRAPDLPFLRRVADAGLRVWVDAGLRDLARLLEVLSTGAGSIIAATETMTGPALLRDLCRVVPPGAVVFGVDLRAGRPVLAPGSSWRSAEPVALMDEALDVGVRRFLFLDTGRVGTGGGIGPLSFVIRLLERCPGVEVSVGGGLSGRPELLALGEAGVSAVLVGSAFHDGRLGKADLVHVCGPAP